MAEGHLSEHIAISIWAVKVVTRHKRSFSLHSRECPANLFHNTNVFCSTQGLLVFINKRATSQLGFPSYNRLLRDQKDLELSRGEIGCFTQTDVTSQKPLNGLVQLPAAGGKNNGMTNSRVVDLVRWKQKYTELVILTSVVLSSEEGRATHNSEGSSAHHSPLSGSLLEDPCVPNISLES